MSEEISQAITNWAEVAISYEQKTEVTLEILGQYFLTRNQFITFDAEIKFYISKGLNEKDRTILEESTLYLYEKNRSPERKLLASARANIKKKITKIYNRLLQELFPSFLPAKPETPPRVEREIVKEIDDDTIPFPSNEFDEIDEYETRTEEDDEDDLLELRSFIGMRINDATEEPAENIPPNFRRSRYGNATKSLPQGNIFIMSCPVTPCVMKSTFTLDYC